MSRVVKVCRQQVVHGSPAIVLLRWKALVQSLRTIRDAGIRHVAVIICLGSEVSG